MLPVSWAEIILRQDQHLSKEVLLVSVGSKGCKVTSWQSWRLEKKSCRPAWVQPQAYFPVLSIVQLYHPKILMDWNFAACWPTETLNTSLERSWPHYYHSFCSKRPKFGIFTIMFYRVQINFKKEIRDPLKFIKIYHSGNFSWVILPQGKRKCFVFFCFV